MKSKESFEFRYGGENFIDLNTLITSQFHFLAVVNELQKELHPKADLKIKVGAFKEGSFVVDLLIESSLLDVFNENGSAVIFEVIGGFASLLAIHEYLKGKKPEAVQERKDSDNIEIKVEGNNNTIEVNKKVFHIYKNNVPAARAIQQTFESLGENNEIESVSIIKDNKPIVDIGRDSFQILSEPNPYLGSDHIDQISRNETVYIKKANLLPEKNRVWKWEFIHRGRDISAKITDKDFERKINEGMAIRKGDRMIVDLIIKQKFSEQFNTFIDTGKYEIARVIQYLTKEEQGKLDV